MNLHKTKKHQLSLVPFAFLTRVKLLIWLLLASRYLNPTFAVLFPFTLSFDKRIEEVNQAPVGEVKKDGKRDYKIFHRVFFFKR